MPRTRIKICGITRPEDAALAAELGADAIGLNFVAGPRKITLDIARQILMLLPPLVSPVALASGPTTQAPDAPTIAEIRAGPISAGRGPLNISIFQCYGPATFFFETTDTPACLWPVCRLDRGSIVDQILAQLAFTQHHYSTIVLDSTSDKKLGGTGKILDWSSVREACDLLIQREIIMRFILAGGLNPGNVAEAIRIARPWAVDVSSGVEVPGKPGIKDPAKLRDFIQAAQGA